MKNERYRLLVIVALGLVACGSDSKQPKDSGTKKDKTTSTNPDISITLPDTSPTKKDKGTPVPDSAATCTPYVAKANTGKEPCSSNSDCGADEICLPNDANTSAACVGKCCYDENKAIDDPANTCPVPDATKMKSFCYWTITDENQNPVGYDACAFICAYKGTTYTCPNATDNCVKDQQDPTISYCDPK